MMLNFSGNHCVNEQGKKSLVIHEFGHALGLDHEHQHSDFWDTVEPYFDVTRMKDEHRFEKGMSSFGFKKKYGKGKRFFGIKERTQEEYDSDSIMHYR